MIRQDRIPHILKYMGGKREMLDDIKNAIFEMNLKTDVFCDLFAGTSIVGYAFSDTFRVVSNDIQRYSSIFGNTYFSDLSYIKDANSFADNIVAESSEIVRMIKCIYPQYKFEYNDEMNFFEMSGIEEKQMSLINESFEMGFSLFKKNYSGTYWSYEQCMWIDAIRAIAERYVNQPVYYAIMSALVYAASYSTQSTGHFAQYRTLTHSNYKSILMYRLKSIPVLFHKKLVELIESLHQKLENGFRSSSLDYVDCIATLPIGTLVYADPPYSAVHYSRFYHVLETLVRYDNPKLEFKGRYRDDRYQSPFDQHSNVRSAFYKLFTSIKVQKCHLLLSYSDNAMLSLKEINAIAQDCLGKDYERKVYSRDYTHMKMGRNDEYKMDVQELLISFKAL